jgi:hypothetical protein
MSKDKRKKTQGIARSGRGEQQPLEKDRAQRVSLSKDGPASGHRRELEKSDRKAGKTPRASGHS